MIMMKKTILFCAFLAVLILGTNCKKDTNNAQSQGTSSFDASFLQGWIELHLDLFKHTSGYTPPVASRTIAYTYLALYESVVPGMKDHISMSTVYPISNDFPVVEENKIYYYPACATAAMAYMLRSSFPLASSQYMAKIDSIEAADLASYSTKVPQDILERSLAFGEAVAMAIEDWSSSDGGYYAFTNNYPSSYVPPSGPGLWVPTPSPVQPVFHYKSAMQPYWGENRPFLQENVQGETFLDAPLAYSTDPGSDFYAAANAVYQQGLNNTPEQTTIAQFWSDDVGTYTPPGHSLAITKIILNQKNSNLALASEVLAKIGIAVSDAFINCFKVKYYYNLERPVTFIQENIDNSWNTLIGTPPFPEYASCHSTQSAATARILTHYFGGNVAFVDNSKGDMGYAPRSFNNFYEFAQEAAISRFYGGVHYNFSCSIGYQNGLKIGDNVLSLSFK